MSRWPSPGRQGSCRPARRPPSADLRPVGHCRRRGGPLVAAAGRGQGRRGLPPAPVVASTTPSVTRPPPARGRHHRRQTAAGAAEQASITARTQPVVTVVDTERWSIGCPAGSARLRGRGRPGRGGRRPRPPSPRPRRRRSGRHRLWTSGSTGVPKGAVFDHRNLAAVAGRDRCALPSRSTAGCRRCPSPTSAT